MQENIFKSHFPAKNTILRVFFKSEFNLANFKFELATYLSSWRPFSRQILAAIKKNDVVMTYV